MAAHDATADGAAPASIPVGAPGPGSITAGAADPIWRSPIMSEIASDPLADLEIAPPNEVPPGSCPCHRPDPAGTRPWRWRRARSGSDPSSGPRHSVGSRRLLVGDRCIRGRTPTPAVRGPVDRNAAEAGADRQRDGPLEPRVGPGIRRSVRRGAAPRAHIERDATVEWRPVTDFGERSTPQGAGPTPLGPLIGAPGQGPMRLRRPIRARGRGRGQMASRITGSGRPENEKK